LLTSELLTSAFSLHTAEAHWIRLFSADQLAADLPVIRFFDEKSFVGPMTYKQSEQLLLKRVTCVPRPFLALCYVLAGGLPRDLVRAVRALIDVTLPHDEKSLPEITRALVRRELESVRQASFRQLAENAGPGSLLTELYGRRGPGEKPDELEDAALRLATAAWDVESDACRQMRR
jgi:hypothetical protein